MPDRPQPIDDPYRTLGLQPGATMAEVKRAYRQLAKAYHPDSAGEAALPRFLAIHEAYERLRTGRVTRGAAQARAGSAAASPPTAEPWRADPERARAARERARAGRRGGAGSSGAGRASAGAGPAGSAPGPGPAGSASGAGRAGAAGRASGASGPTGRDGRSTGTTGTAGPSRHGPSGTTGSGRGAGRRQQRKATMGSTSYDEARDPTDATWSGASWYGPSTGEYWIVNPREYADPRKHGPGYQERARRPLGGDIDGEALDDDASVPLQDAASAASDAAAASEPPPAAGARGRTAAPEPARTHEAPDDRARRRAEAARRAGRFDRSPRWAAAAGAAPAWGRGSEATATDGARPSAIGSAGPGRGGGLLGGSPREWVGGASDDPIRRLGVALVAWPPIGLAAAAAIGDITGCTTYSAACTGSEPLLPWLAQAGILGLLLLLPPVARLLAGGAIGVVIALLPITFLLIAVGGSGEPQAGFALATLLAVAWLVGLAWAATQLRRRGGVGGTGGSDPATGGDPARAGS